MTEYVSLTRKSNLGSDRSGLHAQRNFYFVREDGSGLRFNFYRGLGHYRMDAHHGEV